MKCAREGCDKPTALKSGRPKVYCSVECQKKDKPFNRFGGKK